MHIFLVSHYHKQICQGSLLRKQRLGRGLLDLRQLDADDLLHKVVQLFNTERSLPVTFPRGECSVVALIAGIINEQIQKLTKAALQM